MKMVKTLLLGSAAGFVAIAGAQAADLPVKAKPVEYVKVCSVYGAGFYYIPGTDTCIKIGGYVRMDVGFNAGGSHGPYIAGANARDTRIDTSWYQTRVRGIMSFDTRSQTEYGVLRSYIRAGWELNTNDANYRGIQYFDRAFIQFAGMTAGKTQSFFDFYANALNYSTTPVSGSDTGHGINLLAYTVQFGGGFSATISLEDNQMRRTGMWDAGTDALALSAFPATAAAPNWGDYAAPRYPDIVANLRIDQPWGSAQIMGAIHDSSAGCVNAGGATPTACFNSVSGISTDADNGTGFAIGGGLMINLPMIGQGDQLWLQATYADGAVSYLGFNKNAGNDLFAMFRTDGAVGAGIGSVGLGWAFDGIFGTASGTTPAQEVRHVEGFQFNAAFQHFWTPTLRTSVFGGYAELDFGSPTDLNSAAFAFCTGVAAAAGPALTAGSTCDPSFSVSQLGTRTIWSPVTNLDIGVEVLYTRFDQEHVGAWTIPANGGRPAGIYTAADQETWSGLFRIQRNFWP